ncbi:hypothetical protein ACFFX1_54945 [Dactylosporangium sucinum]|uniref:Major capsid protein n=1 Tax=Dactylosporangium sucinum TaxID=1424081 RepID=A0A917U2A6_9ACTN|nr:hypothetical protein [Dactylosporangium sucinum]GGM53353.1 hypothetical protein GCM10007977_063710 [Dactylosporangium sucinum]
MPTVAPPNPTVVGDNITVSRIVNSPVLIQRMLRTLVQQRLVGDKILSGTVDLTGTGAVNYEVSEAIMAASLAERVDDLMEYPESLDGTAVSAMASTEKWALATSISDKLVARNRIDIVNRKLIKLANRIAFGFDALTISAVASAVTQTQAAAAAWSNTSTADPFADITLGASVVDALNQGYEIDTVLATPNRWARLIAAAKVIERAPREGGDTLLLTGRLAQIAGLNVWKTTNMPPGVDVMLLDSRQLGSIGWEDQGGGYLGDPRGVQTKRIRLEENDGWKIQGRRIGVPIVQEPGAAIKITGT